MSAPFWRGEGQDRDFHFSDRIARFMEEANERLEDPGYADHLAKICCMEGTAAEQLLKFLKRQKETTGCDLPHRRHVVVEVTAAGPGAVPGHQAIIHTLWGGRVNRPFAMALEAVWEEQYGQKLEVYAGNDCVALMLPHDVPAGELLSLVRSHNVETLLKRRLEGSGFSVPGSGSARAGPFC